MTAATTADERRHCHMKTISRTLNVVLALSTFWSTATAQTTFHRVHSYGFAPGLEHVLRLPSGHLMLYGGGMSPTSGSLSKLAPDGMMLWNEKVEMSGLGFEILLHEGILDAHGKLVFAARSVYPANGALIRMDTNGVVLWALDLEHPAGDVIEASDGSYAVASGAHVPAEPSDWDLNFTKVDTTGTVLLQAHYTDATWTTYAATSKTAFDVVQDSTGAFAIAYLAGEDLWVLKVNALGAPLWHRKLLANVSGAGFGTNAEHPWRMFLHADGNLTLLGSTSEITPPRDLVVIRMDQSGTVISSNRMSTTDGLRQRDAFQATDGTLWSWIFMFNVGAPYNDALVHLTADGGLMSTTRIFHPLGAQLAGASVDSDGGIDLLYPGPTDSLGTTIPREVERVNATFLLECSTTDQPTLSQLSGTVSVLDSFPLYAYAGAMPQPVAMIITDRISIELQTCLSTDLGESAQPTPTQLEIAGTLLRIRGGSTENVTYFRSTDALGRLLIDHFPSNGELQLEGSRPGPVFWCIGFTDGSSQSGRTMIP